MKPSTNCVALVKQFEGCKLAAYPDPATGKDPWTIGWGATGPDVKQGVVWTQAQADARLAHDLDAFAAKVERALEGTPTTQNQFDALVCFAYNVGIGNLSSSTLLRYHKAKRYGAAQAEFAKWNRGAGKVLAGLTKRRAAEAALYGAR